MRIRMTLATTYHYITTRNCHTKLFLLTPRHHDHLHLLDVDIVFLQEVQGEHAHHAAHVLNWPVAPQYEFLADEVWQDYAYGRNAIYDQGHHGNAILSRFPIISAENQDVSAHRFEH